MCNLYSHTSNKDAIKRAFKVTHDRAGNLPSQPAIFPDQMAPIVRNSAEGRTLEMMRWGFPGLPKFGNRPITNVRNLESGYWKAWLKAEFRCLVPATSFCEYTDSTPKIPHWFALSAERPLFAFAGIWRPWTGTRGTKAEPVEGEHLLFSFLTCEANDVVRPIHTKAMPVILTEDDWDIWLDADTPAALRLQQPFPNERLAIVATGARQDG